MVKDLGIYLHIPFCLQKCKYCDFVSFKSSEEQKQIYVSAIIKEVEQLSKLAKNRTVSTIYIGGGTPTTLSSKQLTEIINNVFKYFSINNDAEITVEANPETVSLKYLRELKDCNVNRISMGVQAMNNRSLKTIGRIHDVKKVIESYASCIVAGFKNINYDLIFALPNQSKKEFLDGLRDLLKLQPPHISLYSLQLENGTKLFQEKDIFKFASEIEEREMYYNAREILAEHGLNQYEISNFAKNGFKSRHNERYWNCEEYLGIGLNASSYFNNVRYQNPADFNEYLNFIDNFKPLYQDSAPLTREEQQSEFIVLGLRKTEGISIKEFEEKFFENILSIYAQQIKKHIDNKLLILTDNRLYLSEKGMDLSNQVMCDFV